jgi:hypothetical protein
MTWGDSHYGGHTEAAADALRTRWFFAEGSEGFFETYELLANFNRPTSSRVLDEV